ncbi:MAG: hypothetical protein HY457_00360 [Parcubacteria group bacterium]|nr:hypothetical protein [Parcubacteria group bacterium]
MSAKATHSLRIDATNLHHAYCLPGGRDVVLKSLLRFLEDVLQFTTRGNPDFWYEACDTLGIEESRRLKEMQSRTSSGAGRKIFIVAANSMTREAQNALLKVFEEPTEGTHFFLIVPDVGMLLPTLRSRLHVVTTHMQGVADSGVAKEFLRASFPERVRLLGDIIEEKDKHKARAFLDELERVMYAEDKVQGTESALRDIEKCRGYLDSRSPSVKMILEHVALIVK